MRNGTEMAHELPTGTAEMLAAAFVGVAQGLTVGVTAAAQRAQGAAHNWKKGNFCFDQYSVARIGQQTFLMNTTVGENVSMASLSLLTKSNKVFTCYLFWASVLVLKMLLMSLLTVRQRMKSKTFANPEDVRMNKLDEVRFGNPNVERVRRAHRNDLENVLPFLIMSLAYVASGPHALTAQILIRIGSSSRILHTLMYAFGPVPQPTRLIAFTLTLVITIYMAVYVICCTIKYI